jgi:hypothetical protein
MRLLRCYRRDRPIAAGQAQFSLLCGVPKSGLSHTEQRFHGDRGELYYRVGFIVTDLPIKPGRVVHLNNHRGTVRQHIKDPKENPLRNPCARTNQLRSELACCRHRGPWC